MFGPTHGLRAEVVPKPVELAVVHEDNDEGAGDGSADRYRVAWAKFCPKDHSQEWDYRAC